MTAPIRLSLGDTVEMRKDHPCGGRLFRIERLGSDVRITCVKCGRDVTMPRVKLEKQIRKIIKDDVSS